MNAYDASKMVFKSTNVSISIQPIKKLKAFQKTLS